MLDSPFLRRKVCHTVVTWGRSCRPPSSLRVFIIVATILPSLPCHCFEVRVHVKYIIHCPCLKQHVFPFSSAGKKKKEKAPVKGIGEKKPKH